MTYRTVHEKFRNHENETRVTPDQLSGRVKKKEFNEVSTDKKEILKTHNAAGKTVKVIYVFQIVDIWYHKFFLKIDRKIF